MLNCPRVTLPAWLQARIYTHTHTHTYIYIYILSGLSQLSEGLACLSSEFSTGERKSEALGQQAEKTCANLNQAFYAFRIVVCQEHLMMEYSIYTPADLFA